MGVRVMSRSLILLVSAFIFGLHTSAFGQSAELRDLPVSPAERCSLRTDLAVALKTYKNVNWPAIRDVCNGEIEEAKKRDPIGFS